MRHLMLIGRATLSNDEAPMAQRRYRVITARLRRLPRRHNGVKSLDLLSRAKMPRRTLRRSPEPRFAVRHCANFTLSNSALSALGDYFGRLRLAVGSRTLRQADPLYKWLSSQNGATSQARLPYKLRLVAEGEFRLASIDGCLAVIMPGRHDKPPWARRPAARRGLVEEFLIASLAFFLSGVTYVSTVPGPAAHQHAAGSDRQRGFDAP